MSHTNSTANYQLPQFLGTDKPAWLTDVNQAFADIDTTMKANEVSAGQANALATQNASAISTQSGQISTLSTKVTALETAQPTDEAQIETNRQNIATNAQNIVEIDNRLGHTSIATIGDGTVTGAIADLDSRPSVSDADDVTYDNTDSGLTATNVQDAIDELAQGAGSTETVRYYNGYIQYTTDGGTTWNNLINVDTPVQILPALTSNNSSPLGVASGDSAGSITPTNAYMVIDDSTDNEASLGAMDDYVMFTFTNPTFIKYLTIKARSTSGATPPAESGISLDYSEDGTLWVNGGTMYPTLNAEPSDYTQNVNATVKAIRVRKTLQAGSVYISHLKAFN